MVVSTEATTPTVTNVEIRDVPAMSERPVHSVNSVLMKRAKMLVNSGENMAD